MRQPFPWFLASIALLCATLTVPAQTELQKSLQDIKIAPHWIYDDLPKAFDEAKTTGKPILVVLRCVPCPPGRTLDLKLMQPDKQIEDLETKFVCVRVVQTNGLDLNLFQYDYDQSWAAMFLNADKTVYARYGTRIQSGPNSDTHLTLPSFRKAAERVLELHKGYPANKAQFASNIGKAPAWRYPEQIPGLQDKPKKAAVKQNCIHCHMVREYQLRAQWEQGKLSETDLYVYPMPNNIGLTIDIDDGLRIKSVKADSFAARAGLAAGDELTHLNAQPLTSLADIQWVLHTIPQKSQLAVKLLRGGETLDKKIDLSGKWKESDIGWRASSWYGLRQGLKVEPLSAAAKQAQGIPAEGLALAVKGMFGKGAPKLQKAGLKKDDVIIEVDGKSAPMTESQFLVWLRLTHGPADAVNFTVLRGQQKQQLKIPMW